MSMHDLVEEPVPLDGRDLRVLRPRDAESLLDDEAFTHEEFLPYWAELWPSARALAAAVSGRALRGARISRSRSTSRPTTSRTISPSTVMSGRALRGARTLELGCGLGLPSIAAALAGGRVLAVDWSAEAVELTRANAERNGASLETLVCSWTKPAPLLDRAPWDLVLASDVLYEARNGEALLDLLPRLTNTVWLADPGRKPAAAFLEAAGAEWTIAPQRASQIPQGAIYRLRRS